MTEVNKMKKKGKKELKTPVLMLPFSLLKRVILKLKTIGKQKKKVGLFVKKMFLK